MKVWHIKPAIDNRDGERIIRSRIGLSANCEIIFDGENIYDIFVSAHSDCDVIIADECQFFTAEHIDQLRKIVDELNIPVMCVGLRADFMCKLFTGSKRLFELADSISEI